MTETGRVVALEEGAVWVETLRRGSCGACAARSGCGHGLLSSVGSRPELVRAVLSDRGPQNLDLHDTVCISIPEQRFLRGIGLLYLLPLLCTVGAAVLGSSLGNAASDAPGADLRAALGALLGLALGLAAVRWYSRRPNAAATSLHPVVTARL